MTKPVIILKILKLACNMLKEKRCQSRSAGQSVEKTNRKALIVSIENVFPGSNLIERVCKSLRKKTDEPNQVSLCSDLNRRLCDITSVTNQIKIGIHSKQ